MRVDDRSVFEFIKGNILDFSDIDPADIQFDSIVENIGLDSLDFVDIQLAILKTYNVSLDPEVLAGAGLTLGSLASYIVNKIPVDLAASA